MRRRLFISNTIYLTLWTFSSFFPSGAHAQNDSVVSYSETGQVILRTRRPSGGVSDYLPHAGDEILVRFKNGANETVRFAAHSRHRATRIKQFRHIDGLDLVKLPPGVSLEHAIKSYRDRPDVLYAEPNYVIEHLGVPNDPSFPTQWNLLNTGQNGGTPGADIKAVQAWDITTGSSNVVVAVIDSGVDYTHQDLAANMWRNEADCNNNGIDDDGNGYIDDCYGIDAFNDDSDPMDDHDHGTHVAGIIGAIGNNSVGVVGVNWNVKIMACKFLGADGFGTVADAIQCLEYVKAMKDRGVNIVATNNSWGSYGYSMALYDAIETHQQRGILFIAAAGNDGNFNERAAHYPATYFLPNIISVAATNQSDGLAYFSNAGGTTVHLGAPGESIISTTIGNSYSLFSGTSMATPHVTGVAALLKAQNAARDWKAIKNLILASGTTLSSLVSTITQKRLDAKAALTCSNSPVTARVLPKGASVNTALSPVNLAALNINCATPNGIVRVTVSPGGQLVTLRDDGISPDQGAGDGIYSGRWSPLAGGTFTLQFPDGDTVTVNVDADLKAGFPVKTFHGPGTAMGGQALHTLVADIDGDLRPEVIVTGLANGPLYAWKVDGSPVTGWPLDEISGAGYPAAGELSSAWAGSEVASVYFGIKNSFLSAYSGSGTSLPGWPQQRGYSLVRPPTLADLDGDGFDEIIVGESDYRLHVYKKDGSELFGWPKPTNNLPLWGYSPQTPAIADLDGDGRLDLVTAHGNYVFAYHGDGTLLNGFPVAVTGQLPVMVFPTIGDVDGDGKLEIVVPAWLGNESTTRYRGIYGVQVISSDGKISRSISAAGTLTYSSAPALADLDGDGIPEIIFQTDGALNVWRGDGTNFPGWPVAMPGSWTANSSPVVGDVDGDGLPDIVITTTYSGLGTLGSVLVYNRNGVLHPRFPKILYIGHGAVPAIADLDRDGRNEIVVTGTGWDGFIGDYDRVWVYDLGGPQHGAVQWGQLMGGPKHQGMFRGGYNIPRRFLLSVGKEGAGLGTVTSKTPGINCGSDCSETFGSTVVVTLTAVAASGSLFLGWHGGGCSGTGSCTVTVASDSVVTATFISQTLTFSNLYVRSLNPEIGASITVNLTDRFGYTSGSTAFNRLYDSNALVTLTAPTTIDGNVFQKWLRDDVDWGTTPTTQVIMAVDHTMTAVYLASSATPTLTVASSNPSSGVTIGASPSDNNGKEIGSTQFTYTYNSNTVVSLFAPSAAGGNDFNRWSGCYSSSGTACTVVLTGDKTVTAVYGTAADSTSPDTSVTSGPAGVISTNSPMFSWTGTDNVTAVGNLQYAYRLDPLEANFSAFGGTTTIDYSNLANGNYTFFVKAKDQASNEDPTPAVRAFSVNVGGIAPDTAISSGPLSLTKSASASFSFTATVAGSTFQCSLNGAAFAACTSPKKYTGLANGNHAFQVRAIDPAKNIDPTPASLNWAVDWAAPNTSIASNPPTVTNVTSATFAFTSNEPATTFQCRLDAAAFAPCANPATYADLAAGKHTFRVRAVDPAGNVDASPALYTWNIDTTPPNTSITRKPAAVTTSTSATFTFTSNQAKSTFECNLDNGGFSACASPVTYNGLAMGVHNFKARAIDPVSNVDATPANVDWTIQ